MVNDFISFSLIIIIKISSENIYFSDAFLKILVGGNVRQRRVRKVKCFRAQRVRYSLMIFPVSLSALQVTLAKI